MTVALFLLNISLEGSSCWGEWGEKVISVGDSWVRALHFYYLGAPGRAMNPDGHRRIDVQVQSLMKGLGLILFNNSPSGNNGWRQSV